MTDTAKKPSPMRPCAICGKPVVEAYKPFCSKRCANIDLGRWLKSSYAIAGEPVDEAEQAERSRPRDENED
jgi:endogenous inhibitor of DNA gyrase (YacG/DUF329 family)